MKNRTFRNKAFLSYRHVEKDEKLAALLQEKLEHYRIPRGLRGSRPGTRGVGRIFRDTTDLGARADLTEELRRELDESEYLIVLCSEAAVGSKWIAREIGYFLQSHSADKILPVLAAGEPETILPALLSGTEGMAQHPVACDFRGDRRQALREELPRLAAALIGCSYDELVNRRQRYETRRLAAILSAVILALGAVAVYYAVTSARIRQSLQAQQIETSNRLAIQSENALSLRHRFEAVRFALDALPAVLAGKDREGAVSAGRGDAGEDAAGPAKTRILQPAQAGEVAEAAGSREKAGAAADRPVSASAMLALQRALGAYVPEGSRSMAQTGEFRTPDRIVAFDVQQIGDRTYLAACCEKNKTMLWRVDTGEVLYDSKQEVKKAGLERKNGSENTMRLSADTLIRSSENTLAGIDISTGKERWQITQTGILDWQILDAEGDRIAVLALGRGNDRQLQLRRTEDGKLLYSRQTGTEPDPGHMLEVYEAAILKKTDRLLFIQRTITKRSDPDFIEEALFGKEESDLTRKEEPDVDAQIVKTPENAEDINNSSADRPGSSQSLYALDPATGEEILLVQAERIRDFKATEDGRILCAVYEGPNVRDTYSREDGTNYCYTGTGEESFRIICADPRSGRILWEKKSSCTQDYGTSLLSDLEIEGRKACLLSAGTRVDILAQDTGKSLYSFDLPGLMAYVGTGDFLGQEALTAVLQDGAQAFCCFSTGEILKKDAVFPDSIARARESGGKLFFLLDEEGRDTLEDRIRVFSQGFFDPDLSALFTPSGDRIREDEYSCAIIRSSTSEWEGVFEFAAKDCFVVREQECLRCVDARTGRSRWETAVGGNIIFAGLTADEDRLVFRDYFYDSRTLAIRSAQGLPAPEETWRILDLSDGSMETVKNLMQNIPGKKKWNTYSHAVGGDALVLLVRDDGNQEVWLIRYSISHGTVQTLCLRDQSGRNISSWGIGISVSPDGNSTLCRCINGTTLEQILLAVDWKKMETRAIEGLPQSEMTSGSVWSPGGGQTAFLDAYSRPLVLMNDKSPKIIDQDPDTLVEGVGFLDERFFLVVERDYQVRFLISQDGIDILLPVDRTTRRDNGLNFTQIYQAFVLPDNKVLLQYGTLAFVFSLETGEVEAAIANVKKYNPQTDTLLIRDREGGLYIAPRYSWQDLVRKGQKTLETYP